jgi:hypothetical protein
VRRFSNEKLEASRHVAGHDPVLSAGSGITGISDVTCFGSDHKPRVLTYFKDGYVLIFELK